MRWERSSGHVVSDDPELLDLARIAHWLADDAYWALGRPAELVMRSFANSVPIGLYDAAGEQLGCCRWVTDRATFAWLCDVYVAPEARAGGLGTWMVACASDHPAVAGTRALLATRDAHGLYAKFGFEPLPAPERWMVRDRRTDPAAS